MKLSCSISIRHSSNQIVCRTRIFNSLPQINNFTILTIIWLEIVMQIIPSSIDHLINMQNVTPSASMNNRMGVNPNNIPQQGNGYNCQTSYGAQSGDNSHNNEISSMIMQINNDFSKRLTMIENYLSKLRNIENEVTLVRADVSPIKTDNIDFNRRLIETEISCQTIMIFMIT